MTAPPAAAEPEALLARLRAAGLTLATAESLTGGLIGAALTEVAGSSASYRGGVVCYATDLKATLVGVPQDLLDAHGPVAPQTAAALAEGIAERCTADLGLAVTGVAGPNDQDGHPVGEVYVAVAGPDRAPADVRRLALSGSRPDIRHGTVAAAFALLAEVLAGLDPA
jgi:nicotinamide-nucleotide amidase